MRTKLCGVACGKAPPLSQRLGVRLQELLKNIYYRSLNGGPRSAADLCPAVFARLASMKLSASTQAKSHNLELRVRYLPDQEVRRKDQKIMLWRRRAYQEIKQANALEKQLTEAANTRVEMQADIERLFDMQADTEQVVGKRRRGLEDANQILQQKVCYPASATISHTFAELHRCGTSKQR